MSNIIPGHSSKVDENKYSLSFAVMHTFYHFFYSIGYDPSCEEIPSRELIKNALSVFMKHEEDSNANLTESREATDFEWRRHSPRPFERAEMYFGSMVKNDGRESTYEFEDREAWLFQDISMECLMQIAFAAAWCGAHDIIIDAMFLCTKQNWASEYTVDQGIMPMPMTTLEANLMRLLNDIGTTHQEREICEYLAAHEKLETREYLATYEKLDIDSPSPLPLPYAKELKYSAERFNCDYVQNKTRWFLGIEYNKYVHLLMRRDELCNVMYSDISTHAWHGYYELDDKLSYRQILKDPN